MTDIDTIEKLYRLSASPRFRPYSVTQKSFCDFSLGVSLLLKTVGEAADEEIWRKLLLALKRYRFLLAAAPLAFNDDSVSIAQELDSARVRIPIYCQTYPSAAEVLARVLDLGLALHKSNDNPIRGFLIEEFPGGIKNGAVLLKDSRLIERTESVLRRHPATNRWSIITSGQLKKATSYSRIVIIGPVRWFPDYVITAPRAEEIISVKYAWIRDKIPTQYVFDQGRKKNPNYDDHSVSDTANSVADGVINAEEFLPRIDWATIQGNVQAQAESNIDEVSAKLAILEGDFGVFFDDDESTTLLTLDPDTDEPTERIRRISMRRLLPGMFVLLRTTGGGDYILPLADKILGKDAVYARSCQNDWKALLRRAVVESSLLEVSVRLLDFGSTCANETNLRNWMSPRTIKTHDPRDFAAIMRLVGLEQRTYEYWKAMAAISRAHHRAGMQIRKALLRRLAKLDLTPLERNGSLEIALPDADAGTLTAFRIIAIAPLSQQVSATKLNHPFQLGDL